MGTEPGLAWELTLEGEKRCNKNADIEVWFQPAL
jgi:hypothetical protein